MAENIKIPQNVINTQYAVRGYLAQRANELTEQLRAGKKLPFDEIQPLNIGNPQAIGQKPLSQIRDVISLVSNPQLFKHAKDFPEGHVQMAKQYQEGMTVGKGQTGDDFHVNPNYGGVGAQSNSCGNGQLVQRCVDWISKRDGVQAKSNSIFLTNGASEAGTFLQNMCAEPNWGIMGPIPVQPFQTGMASLTNGTYCGQQLDEENKWGIDIKEIERAYKDHSEKGVNIKCLTVINPGNPTGNVASQENIRDALLFCRDKGLIYVADEVQQDNVQTEKKFFSARQVAHKEGITVPIASMHSTSKGFQGECGLRGGLVHLENFDDNWLAEFNKLNSISLCSNIVGQLAMTLVCNPPEQGEAAATYKKERAELLEALKRKSFKVQETFAECEGIFPQVPEGSLQLFPRIEFSEKFLATCKQENVVPDLKFCEYILNETGICIVNGSGFDQRPGTQHFRITNLLHDTKLDAAMQKFKDAYKRFREMQ